MPSGFALGPTAIHLFWLPPPPIDINGIIDYYVVEVTEIRTGRFWSFVAVDNHINIGSLNPHHVYECIIATYTVEIGPFTAPFNVTSEEIGNFYQEKQSMEVHVSL